MKFKYNYSILDEVFFKPKNLDIHYNKHVLSNEDGLLKIQYMSKDAYNNLADRLSTADAKPITDTTANIIGYVTKTDRIVKHNKFNKLTIVYVDDDIRGHEVISLYKQPTEKFFRKLNNDNSVMAYKSDIE